MNNEQIIWDYLNNKGLSKAGIAGLMGNLYAESGLNPKNLQNNYNKKLKLTDEEYTQKVDNNSYTNFIKDSAGYGLAQWTYWSRKRDLLNYSRQQGKSIGDLILQLDFLMIELNQRYKKVIEILKNTDSIEEASNAVLLQFEKPADQSKKVQNKRINFSKEIYNKLNKNVNITSSNSPLVQCTFLSPNCTKPRNHIIDTVTIHCVVGQLTAEQILNLSSMKNYNPNRGASCNYAIGRDGSIGLGVEEKNRSWCSSNRDNDHRAITIEVASDKTAPYAVRPEAYKSLINLLVDICKRNNIQELKWQGNKNLIGQTDKQNMTVHRWFANKSCPGDWLYNRHGQIAEEVNKRLKNPIEKDDDEDMTQEKFNEFMDNWIAEQAKKDAGAWSNAERQWAENNGLVKGNKDGYKMYKKPITREEFIVVLYRALHRYFME